MNCISCIKMSIARLRIYILSSVGLATGAGEGCIASTAVAKRLEPALRTEAGVLAVAVEFAGVVQNCPWSVDEPGCDDVFFRMLLGILVG